MKKIIKISLLIIFILFTVYSFINTSFIIWFYDYFSNSYFIVITWLLCSLIFFIYNYNDFSYFFTDSRKKELMLKKESKLKKYKDISYYRDIPFDGDIFKIYYALYQYNLVDNKTDLIGAFLLNLIRKGEAILTNDNKGIYIDFDKVDCTYSSEFDLIRILRGAAKDNVLEINELKKYAKRHRKVLGNWLYNAINNQTRYFKRTNMIYEENGKMVISSEFNIEVEKIIGFKKFLLNFSNIDDREVMEVKLWEMYLVLAELLGIADKVIKKFKNKTINNYDIEKLITMCKMPGYGIMRCLLMLSSLFYGLIFFYPIMIYIIILNLIVKLIS